MDQQRSAIPTGTPTGAQPTLAARKQFSTNPGDPNEPAKPLSAYALFFRDTVSAVKQQNRNCNFNELQDIVNPMWEGLGPQQKEVYNRKAENARIEYYKLLRIHRQQQRPNDVANNSENFNDFSNNNSPIVDLDSSPDTVVNTNAYSNSNSTLNSPGIGTGTSPGPGPGPGTGYHVASSDAVSPANNVTTTSAAPEQQSPVCQAPATTNQVCNPSTNEESTVDSSTMVVNGNQSPPRCTRDGCTNYATASPEWDMEYCSNECVIIHCRCVFNAFVKENMQFAAQDELQSNCVNNAGVTSGSAGDGGTTTSH